MEASGATVKEFEIEGEALKYEAVAVAEIPEGVRETLAKSELDGRVVVGLLTLERANMLPDVATGKLKKVGTFVLLGEHKTGKACRPDNLLESKGSRGSFR